MTKDALGVVLDEANVTAAFDAGDANPGQIFRVRAQSKIFFQIVLRDLISTHCVPMNFSVLHKDVRLPFDQDAEQMRATRNGGEQAMKQDHDKPAADRREKRRTAVYRASQHRGENHDQHHVEDRFFRKRSFAAESNHEQSGIDYDDAAQ